MPEVRVLFLRIGNPVPPFIRNRILQLDKTGQIKAIVLAPYDSLNEFPLQNGLVMQECPIRFNLMHTILPLLWFSIRYPVSTIKLWISLSCFSFRTRARTFTTYHSLVRVRKPEVVHFQWTVTQNEIEWIHNFFKTPVIISARGSQVTVFPATSQDNENNVRKSFLSADFIHAVSESMAEACIRLGADPGKMFVNYNGIDAKQYSKSFNRESFNDTLHLISTGRLMWSKGYLWQLMLVNALKNKGLDIKLKIIGHGPDWQGLQYTIIRLGLQQEVILEGRKSANEVTRYLQLSDIYISTSAAEGLSNAVLEAVACGLPVIAFDCEGMNEIIDEGHNGFIVPFGEIESMAEKVRLLYGDRQLLENMGSNGALIATEKFDYRIHVQKMIEFYKLVCKADEQEKSSYTICRLRDRWSNAFNTSNVTKKGANGIDDKSTQIKS